MKNSAIQLCLGLTLVICAVLTRTPYSVADSSHPIVIGIIAPLTGKVAVVGEAVRNSALVAQRLPQNSNVRIVIEDDQFDPKQSMRAAQKLIHVDKVHGLIIFGSGPTLAVADLVENSRVVTFSMAYSDQVAANRKYIYRTFVTASVQAKAIATEARRRKYRTIGIVSTENEAMIAIGKAFQSEWSEPLVLDETIEPGDTDLHSVASKVSKSQIDGLLLLTIPPQISILSKQMRTQKWRGTIFSSSHLNNPSEISAAGNALDGSWLVTIDDSNSQTFKVEYARQFGKQPLVDGSLAYDLINELSVALSKSDPTGYLDKKSSLSGIYGPWLKSGAHTFEPAIRISELTPIK